MANDTEFTPQGVLNRAYDDVAKAINVKGPGEASSYPLSSFKPNHIDNYTTTNVTYIGSESKDGIWLLTKIDSTGNFPVFTYATINNNPTLTTYSDAWTARTTATYNLFSVAV